MIEHYEQYGIPAFYLNTTILDEEGIREKLEEEKAMLEREMLSIQNTKLRIASLEAQLGE
jgi:hypothetical protein